MLQMKSSGQARSVSMLTRVEAGEIFTPRIVLTVIPVDLMDGITVIPIGMFDESHTLIPK